MKASSNTPAKPQPSSDRLPPKPADADDGIDQALLEESLAKTVWERMQANDDALHLAHLLQAGMIKRAKSE